MTRLLPIMGLGLWALVAVSVPWLNLHPELMQLDRILEPPGVGGWLGFDDLGRAMADRLLAGARTSFWVAAWVVSISAVIGSLLGTLAAYVGGWVERLVVQVIDVVLAFPGILLAIALAGMLGPGMDNVVLALSAVGWVGFARLARAQVLTLKHREHVLAAEALGTSTGRILLHHLLPLMSAPLIVEATFGVASVVIAEAGLSFLGLGVQPPDASWGSMIRDGTRYMLVAPHMVLAPGIALWCVVMSVNLLGDRLRDYFDVRSR